MGGSDHCFGLVREATLILKMRHSKLIRMFANCFQASPPNRSVLGIADRALWGLVKFAQFKYKYIIIMTV